MKREKPVSGEFYQHFKGKLYQIKMLAFDCETEKEKVVYQAMYAPYTCWVRELDEFMSPVDRIKYPDVSQEYRFEKVNIESVGQSGKKESCLAKQSVNETVDNRKQQDAGSDVEKEKISDEALLKALKTGQPGNYLSDRITSEEIANRGLLQLLDAETFREKRQIFIGLKQYMDKHMLNNVAVALDIVLEEGDEETQYESIMRCMEAFERYEGGRLR